MANDAIFYPDPAPVQPKPKLPAAAFTTGGQPPRIGRQSALLAAAVAMSWPQPNEPTLHQQNLAPRKIAPLTLSYGQQPAVQGPITPSELGLIARAWPEDNEPRLNYRNAYPSKIAPQTLIYGNQPRPTGPIVTTDLRLLVEQWRVEWPAQAGAKCGAWNVPVIVSPFVPSGRLQLGIPAAWAFDPVTVIVSVEGAATLPAQGDDPPRDNLARDPSHQARLAQLFALSWDAQRAEQLTPPSVDDAPRDSLARDPYFQAQLARLFAVDWAAQRAEQVVPVTPVVEALPPFRSTLELLTRSWRLADVTPPRATSIAALVVPPTVNDPPFSTVRVGLPVLRHWQDVLTRQRATSIAALVVVPPTINDPPFSMVRVGLPVLRQWQDLLSSDRQIRRVIAAIAFIPGIVGVVVRGPTFTVAVDVADPRSDALDQAPRTDALDQAPRTEEV